MIFVCTGGRDHNNPELIGRILSAVDPKGIIVGDCPTGVDLYVRAWCERNRINFTVFEADWCEYGKAAGPLRNEDMIDFALKMNAILLSFKGGKGTKNCTDYARSKNMIVMEIK